MVDLKKYRCTSKTLRDFCCAALAMVLKKILVSIDGFGSYHGTF